MESGRSTPVAMSRPSSRHSANLEVNDGSMVANSRPPEDTTQHRASSVGQRPECLRSTTWPSVNTENLSERGILKSVLQNRASSIAIIHGSVLTAIGLGWAVYSRIFRFNLESWISKFGRPKPSESEEAKSDFDSKGIEEARSASPKPRLNTSALASEAVATTPVILVQAEAENEASEDAQDASLDMLDKNHDEIETQALLQKHISYLEPWVSKQPLPLLGDEKPSESGSKIENDFRRMSLPAFADLSTAIYRDVRRREQESSPQSPNPPQTPGWERNKENEARMVLCRTINEQYLRLVLALVLELARRIAEIRIERKRQTVAFGG